MQIVTDETIDQSRRHDHTAGSDLKCCTGDKRAGHCGDHYTRQTPGGSAVADPKLKDETPTGGVMFWSPRFKRYVTPGEILQHVADVEAVNAELQKRILGFERQQIALAAAIDIAEAEFKRLAGVSLNDFVNNRQPEPLKAA